MTILVTAATGQLGRLVVESLLARDVEPNQVLATARRPEALADLVDRGVRTAHLDYDDPGSIAAVLDGVERMLLISGPEVGVRVGQHRAVVDAAARAGVGLLAYTSLLHADTSSILLAPDHRETEAAIRAAGVPFALLRNGWYSDGFRSRIEQARATGEIVGSAGEGRVASAARADYAEAAAVVLAGDGHEGAVYELSGDVAWSFPELAEVIGRIVGREVRYRNLSTDEHIAALEAAGLPAATAQFVAGLDGNIRDGALSDTPGDLSRLIGRPTTPIEETLRAGS